MAESSQENETKRRVVWPGGARTLAEPSEEQLTTEPVPPDYFEGSDLASGSDPNWTGIWPNSTAAAQPADIQPTPDPMFFDREPASRSLSDDPQLPPRAWPPDQFGAPPVEFVPESYEPESTAENIRRSGLAWSAGIVFVSAVAFMMLLGWGADLLFGSSPFGLVAGIVIGSAIGFIQFFRITSQIFTPSRKSSEIKPLLSGHPENDE